MLQRYLLNRIYESYLRWCQNDANFDFIKNLNKGYKTQVYEVRAYSATATSTGVPSLKQELSLNQIKP